eukprot:CAMPEP_0114149664 /NCGR_PEP_ID=MMETSP0043_2-20121206/22282_1 /TAXON_ID=464988 /ORGANISM="Hemiselmis andersenii, Strain CCMP644" /LENGTH=132 /DNA_ID=CAMNT_0001244327 /DNA_START=303 /DNA_END=699 /DNA_ORIENTATION=+
MFQIAVLNRIGAVLGARRERRALGKLRLCARGKAVPEIVAVPLPPRLALDPPRCGRAECIWLLQELDLDRNRVVRKLILRQADVHGEGEAAAHAPLEVELGRVAFGACSDGLECCCHCRQKNGQQPPGRHLL